MHAGDRAVTMAGTSALTRSLVFAEVQVVVCVYISAVSVKMFNSDELCNFSKSVLGLLLGRGRSSDTESCVPYKERLQKENGGEPGVSGDEMRHGS